MPQSDQEPISEALRRFQPLALLDATQIELIADYVQLLKAARGTCLMEIGSQESRLLFLLEGELQLIASDGARHRVRHDDPAAEGPICKLRPSRYRVITVTETRYLWVEQDALQLIGSSPTGDTVLVEETLHRTSNSEFIDDNASHGVMFDVLDDLNQGRIMVPSDPEVAIRVGNALGRLRSDERLMAETLSVCPAITLKIVRKARDSDPERRQIRSCRQAVERLGAERVYDLAATCVLRESLRSTSQTARSRMQQWWQQTVRVAAICRVLAGMSERFDPEFARLIALVHSIGEPALLQHAHRHRDLNDPYLLDDVLRANRAELGRILLSYWDLPRMVIDGAAVCNNYEYEHPGEANYLDILLVAQWHAAIGSDRRHQLPRLEDVPAAEKLGLTDPSPRLSLKIIDAANTAIEQTDRLLSGF
jgi:HD-like signal output (HDOD) protein